jgi:hypothetical protein
VITYSITVANEGTVGAHDVVVHDLLPAYMSLLETVFVSPLDLPIPLVRLQQLEWQVGSLPRNGAASMAFTVLVSPDATTGTELLNEVSATGLETASAEAEIIHRVNEIQAQIDPQEGGQVEAPIAGVTIAFPAGAVTETVQLSMTVATTPTAECSQLEFAGRLFFLEAFDANDDPVTSFLEPYTLTVRYQDSWWREAGLKREEHLNLYYWEGSEWVPLLPCDGCSLDAEANELVAVLDHFTEFALGYEHWLYVPMVLSGAS